MSSNSAISVLRKILQSNKFTFSITKTGAVAVNSFIDINTHKFQILKKCWYATKIEQKNFGSKYHPISALEHTQTRMRDILFDKKSLSIEEWKELKNSLLFDFLNLTEFNFDSILMNVMLTTDNVELAKSFMHYLNAIGHEPNFVTCMKYMSLCSRHPTVESQKAILKIFEQIKDSVDSAPVLDHFSVNCIVKGLCATDQWKTAFNYLSKLPEYTPLLDTTNALISAALRNDQESSAWHLLTSSYSSSAYPDTNVCKEYIAFASRCLDKDSYLADKCLSKFFKFLKLKNVIVKQSYLKDIKEYFERHPQNWIFSDAKINRIGLCSGCQNTLDKVYLTKHEFQTLEKSFFKRVVNKSDVFINSSKTEMDMFLRFIENRKPFDIVVDGLNAAHSFQGIKMRGFLAAQLLEIVKGLSVTSPYILILARNHMRGWPPKIMKEINRKACIFYVNNISEDDPLTIYSAMASGPDTLFVSSDLMRDHLRRLDDQHLIQLFYKWQQSHQVFIIPPENENKFPKFKGPLRHHIAIQGSMKKGWHIPYDDEFILEPYEELNNWLCIQPAS